MKTIELKQMSQDELKKKINEFEEEIFNLRFKRAMSPIDNPLRIRTLRRTIARAKTVLNEKIKSEAK
jgi:large subunit ribosomal protein L29